MIKENRKTKYQEYLKSDAWINKRNEVLRKHGRNCRICGSPYRIEIHHKRYTKRGKSILGNESTSDLLSICHDCHMLWHKKQGFRKKIYCGVMRERLKMGFDKELIFTHPYWKVKTLNKYLMKEKK